MQSVSQLRAMRVRVEARIWLAETDATDVYAHPARTLRRAETRKSPFKASQSQREGTSPGIQLTRNLY